jgi:hypothetical protein
MKRVDLIRHPEHHGIQFLREGGSHTVYVNRTKKKNRKKTVGSRLVFIHWHDSRTDAPRLYDREGNYRGKLSANPYDPDSTSNPYGRYGSPFSPDSIKNPYSPSSPTDLYGRSLRIEGR